MNLHDILSSIYLYIYVLKLSALHVPGLKCVCLLCDSSNFTCQTEGACWASVMLANGKEQVIKSCVSLPELNAQVFCHSSNNVTKTECCFTDFCNNITLHLPMGKAFLFVHFTFIVLGGNYISMLEIKVLVITVHRKIHFTVLSVF